LREAIKYGRPSDIAASQTRRTHLHPKAIVVSVYKGGIGMMNDILQSEPVASEFLLYQTEEGRTRLEVRLQEETVWLTQKRMAELLQKSVRTINEHIQNIIKEGELSPESVIRNFRITALDDFLKLSGRDLLMHAGTISHEKAMARAQIEYEKHRVFQINQPSLVEKHFEQVVKKVSREAAKKGKKMRIYNVQPRDISAPPA
jgi:hypothetical protein